MIFVYAFVSPGSDLHDEPFVIQDVSRESADLRAIGRVTNTFILASAERRAKSSCRFVAEYTSRTAMRRTEEAA